MTLVSFEAALERTDEIELTTTGRVTGKPISCPVWFVRRGEKLYLVPGGRNGQSVVQEPAQDARSTPGRPRRPVQRDRHAGH